jgi:hypothetical protein
MTRHLFGDLDNLTSADRGDWIAYLQRHQEADGLFQDPLIAGEGWYAGDPLWCGRPHLTCHVVTALACLGGGALPLSWLDQFLAAGDIERWLGQRDWEKRPDYVGNEVMNVGVLLQYARDFQANSSAGDAVRRLLDWLDTHWIDPNTGVWGGLDVRLPVARSRLVQAAYHLWPLYTYDRRSIPFLEAALGTVLATQNPLGSFGWGVHNPEQPYAGSACEDIDSIEPLVRMAGLTVHDRDDVISALERALPWVLSNQNADGGFVFTRGRRFFYGHAQLQADADVSALFPTWFRTLSLAYLGMALPASTVGREGWQFVDCPGFHFWRPGGV